MAKGQNGEEVEQCEEAQRALGAALCCSPSATTPRAAQVVDTAVALAELAELGSRNEADAFEPNKPGGPG